MKQVLIRRGKAIIEEVPSPAVGVGEILVRLEASCISVGTEMSGIRSSAMPMWKKVLQKPDKAMVVLKTALNSGLMKTVNLVEEKRDAALPIGYSAAGIVIAVGAEITDIVPGERVACAGAQCAYHAEFISVPRNLCTQVPDELDLQSASTVTLGAIAMQGVRRADPTLGETFVVIGLGILGQLTAQLLRASGCRVIGIDVNRDRIKLAMSLGMNIGLHPDDAFDVEQVTKLTDGYGADGVIITAATPSDAVVSSAFKMCRKKGRVVLVGDVGLALNRNDFYIKEIDFRISASYGPGRYDNNYEEKGLDYPLAYVRWTENRNMSEYLKLLAEKKLQIGSMVSASYDIDEAPTAYNYLMVDSSRVMIVLLTYPNKDFAPSQLLKLATKNSRPKEGLIRVAVVGAGAFARYAHLPNLSSLSDRFALRAIVARTGTSATAAGKQFGADYCTTNFEEVLVDSQVDAVIIATRHNLHAQMAIAALKAGKHVLVEKPLSLTIEELSELDAIINSSGEVSPVLLTGYNRRFSPYAKRMAELLSIRTSPFILNYRMNAGYIPGDHWVHGIEGGGRNIGEACHIYDLFTYLTNARIVKITAHSISPSTDYYKRTDNFIAAFSFEDGSIANLTYSAMGNKEYPKEIAELIFDGNHILLNDYKKMDILSTKKSQFKTTFQDKGQREELKAFADAINGGTWPIPWWQQYQTARAAIMIDEMLKNKEVSSEKLDLR
jgi:predicted dehydrogenase/threonine dehydrogenase-like Zn-dependent dehydrogenase